MHCSYSFLCTHSLVLWSRIISFSALEICFTVGNMDRINCLWAKVPLDFRHDNCDMNGIADLITTKEISLNSVIHLSKDLMPLFCIESKLRDFRNIPQSFLWHIILGVLIPREKFCTSDNCLKRCIYLTTSSKGNPIWEASSLCPLRNLKFH